MKIKNNKRTVMWSNLCFLIPLIIPLNRQLYLYSLVITAAVVASFVYHVRPSPLRHLIDRITALTLILSNLILFAITSFYSIYFLVVIILVITAFYFFKVATHRYYIYHAYWHFLSALITTTSLIAYLTY